MKRKCININNLTEYYLISKYLVDQSGTGFNYLLQLVTPPNNAQYMWCSQKYFEDNFRLYENDYTKIKSPFADNEEILKQCSTFLCPGCVLQNNIGGYWCMGHGCRTWDLDVYRDCEFDVDAVYMITVHPETGKVIDIYDIKS